MSDGPSNPQQEREIILAFKDEVAGLRADNERLRAALRSALSMVDSFASGAGFSTSGRTEYEAYRAALEPKPDLRTLLPELAVIRQVMKEPKP